MQQKARLGAASLCQHSPISVHDPPPDRSLSSQQEAANRIWQYVISWEKSKLEIWTRICFIFFPAWWEFQLIWNSFHRVDFLTLSCISFIKGETAKSPSFKQMPNIDYHQQMCNVDRSASFVDGTCWLVVACPKIRIFQKIAWSS